MTRPKIRALLLIAGAGLATGYASVADFTGVINAYYHGAGAADPPCTGAETRRHPASPAELPPPRGSTARAARDRSRRAAAVTGVTEIVAALPAMPGSGLLPAQLLGSGVDAGAALPDNGRTWMTRAGTGRGHGKGRWQR